MSFDTGYWDKEGKTLVISVLKLVSMSLRAAAGKSSDALSMVMFWEALRMVDLALTCGREALKL